MQNSKFSYILKKLLTDDKLSGAELGRKIGVSKETISQYCKGNVEPKSGILIKLAEYFKVSCDYLLTGSEPEDKKESQELGLSGDAIRLLKQCQDERVRGLVDRLLGSPEFYQRAKISFNKLTLLELKIEDRNYYELILEKFLEKNNGDRNKTAHDFEEFLRMDTRMLTDFISDIMIVDLNAYDVIDALTEITE
ncbi:MAG: helix-turn-helix domain-containing protein [Synergistaceae bacterium]|nr:helix-turn-helix domain-containing protein [Synergistaceae bacterium]MBQ6909465.1 helix-turn-helix domain-containing protein [Synergistaceae bacterium]MBR0043807.1 helix-turn-helix domain-containing protein [Synergistaceae bacterium]MBR0095698.1 helix-turn-helix domain-containing protein [Synergistaceae bacterium]MBR0220838.1 helix-turn-helix domain-containing protein [Synergistaceae bacterium]